MTRPYAEVIGDPIAQSKSPAIHNFWLGKLGIDAEYRACHVRADQLADYFRERNADDNWRGCNVTMPHKQAVIPLLDSLEPAAGRIGAVNTIVMRDYYLMGDNTDGTGFIEPLRSFIADRTHRFAYLVGAGGAARAIADVLREEDFRIWSFTRDPVRSGEQLGRYVDDEFLCGMDYLKFEDRLAPRIQVDDDRIDLFINASPLGMTGHAGLEVELSGFPEGTIVYDIVTHPIETPLLMAARAEGLRTIDGLSMLIGQAAVAFEKFFGQPAPREHDAELRALLTT